MSDEEMKNLENGWAKYQLVVLTQLEGHTLMLKDLIKEIAEIKQGVAVSAVEHKNWRDNINSSVDKLQKDLNYIWTDDKGLNARINKLEESQKIDSSTNLKIKGFWAIIGAGAVFLVDIALKIIDFFV